MSESRLPVMLARMVAPGCPGTFALWIVARFGIVEAVCLVSKALILSYQLLEPFSSLLFQCHSAMGFNFEF